MHAWAITWMLASATALAAPVAPVLADPRLDQVRAELQTVVDNAAREGLPEELLTDKVREGLAKGVADARILGVVRNLSTALRSARDEARPHLQGAAPPAELLRAIAQAHAIGIAKAPVDRVLIAAGAKGSPARAIEVLTDLVQRGFPVDRAAQAVGAVAHREPKELSQVTARAEALHADGASRGDALDALARAGASGLGLDHAEQLLHRNANGIGNGNGPNGNDGRGPDRDSSGDRGPGQGQGQVHGHGHN